MNETSIKYPEITGGYFLEIDAYAHSEKSKFISNKNNYITIKYPKAKNILPEQHLYIENKFNEMERKLFKNDYSNIDFDSFAKFFLIQEFTANSDGFWCVKMYKERNDEHFYFGPVWDFDIAYDNDITVYPINYYKEFIFEYGHTFAATSKFIEKILINENVIKKIKYLWKDFFEKKIKKDYINIYIDELVKNINESQRLNFLRWNILDKTIREHNPIIRYSYEKEIKFLKDFIKTRTDFMNQYILGDFLYDKYKSNNGAFLYFSYIYFIILFFFY